MKQERRFTHGTNTEVRADGDSEAKRIAGLGIVFYREGVEGTDYELMPGVKERIMPEAVDRAIAESDDVRGLFNHDSNMLLGRTSAGTMAIRKTDAGIEYDIAPGTTTIHRNVQEHIERGDLTGSSFAFMATDVDWETIGNEDVRIVKGIRLFDIGPVTFPAYEATTAGVRSDAEGEEWKASYRKWKPTTMGLKDRVEWKRNNLSCYPFTEEEKAEVKEYNEIRTHEEAEEPRDESKLSALVDIVKEAHTPDDIDEANECNAAHRAETARQRRIDSARLLSAGKV